MTPKFIFWLLYSFYLISFFWDMYLAYRQYRVHYINKKKPDYIKDSIITNKDYEKARLYQLDKHLFGFVEAIFGKLQMTIVLMFNILPSLWNITGNWSKFFLKEGEILHSIIFVLFCLIIESIISLPFGFYDTFVIEEKHGFNKQSVLFFFTDQFKKILVNMVITAPIVAGVIWIVTIGGKFFFFYVWIFLCVVIFLMMTIYPEFIAPLFDKYTPLPESNLKSKINFLASRVDYPLKKIYVVQGSKRSAHSNAYMYGFWKNKRIVLYDTLLSNELNEELKKILNENQDKDLKVSTEKLDEQNKNKKLLGMTDDEIVAILGHELGHWKLWHTVYNLIIMEVNSFILLGVFAYFYRQKSLYAAFGFAQNQQPIIIGLLLVMQFVAAPYNEIMSVILSYFSRQCEFAADRFSAELGYAKQLCSSLIKLGQDNLSLPIDYWLYSAVYHSHPPTLERIEALKKYT